MDSYESSCTISICNRIFFFFFAGKRMQNLAICYFPCYLFLQPPPPLSVFILPAFGLHLACISKSKLQHSREVFQNKQINFSIVHSYKVLSLTLGLR